MISTYYSVQNIEAWNEAKVKGFLVGNKDYVWEGSLKAYSWMMDQMKKRIVSYCGEFPVWLWVMKPDIHRGGIVNPKEKAILLKVRIHPSRVLLSDFDGWHCVLNDSFNIDSDEEWELYEQGKLSVSKEVTWERIFELEALPEQKNKNTNRLQGVTGRIYLNEIEKIEEFVGVEINL